MKQITTALLMTLILSSCSALDVVKGASSLAGPEKGLEVDANIGQAKTEGNASVAQNANTAVTGQVTDSETYEGPIGQVVNNSGFQLHELLLLVLLAGWAIPSPAEMLLGAARVLRSSVSILLVGRP